MTATPTTSDTNLYIVGDYLFDSELGLITGPSGAHYVCPRMTSLLLHLMEHAGEIVSCRQLMEELWHDDDDHARTLNHSISRLRHYFQDSSPTPAYIETVPNQGYRLIAPVYSSTRQPVINDVAERTSPEPRRKSLNSLITGLRERKVCRSILFYIMAVWLIWEIHEPIATVVAAVRL